MPSVSRSYDADLAAVNAAAAANAAGVAANLASLALKQGLPFVAADQVITPAGPLTLAHGLGVVPSNVEAMLICLTAEQGYSVGDLVPLVYQTEVLVAGVGIAVTVDATNVNVRFGSWGLVFGACNKTTGASVGITPANWRLRLKAYP